MKAQYLGKYKQAFGDRNFEGITAFRWVKVGSRSKYLMSRGKEEYKWGRSKENPPHLFFDF